MGKKSRILWTFLDLLYTYIAGTGTMEHGMKITMDTNAAYNVYTIVSK